MSIVFTSGAFDDIRSRDIRFLEEASKLGDVHVQLWHDNAPAFIKPPKFPLAERDYVLKALRTVAGTHIVDAENFSVVRADIWVDTEQAASAVRETQVRDQGMSYAVIADSALAGFPAPRAPHPPAAQKVVVTGCYDWLHSGHVRFFEEAAKFGDLTVCVGNDATIAELKGPGHPQYPQDERAYVVRSVRHVWNAVISAGSGWLDADAEIRALKPDIFIVNEDGDKACKREYCRELGIEYRVLKRMPADGLPKRSSTDLRGF